MIREQIYKNEYVSPNTKELEFLKKNFPHFFDKEGNFLMDRFQSMLKSEEVSIQKEGYELNFLGKSYARFQTSTETETVIVPDIEHNNQDLNKDSENLYIIGDNLDALKHLLRSYSNKIKCIYIDPPYNTGSDGFVYPDNFSFNAETLSQRMGVTEDEANRIIDMRGKSTHSAWMTFMYPRLILSRDLLSDDGVIFISIDDNEQANLKLMCDEIFGEENFVALLTRKALHTVRNTSIDANKNTDFILCYLKNREYYNKHKEVWLRWRTDKSANYPYDDNDGKGKYKLDPIYARNYAKPYSYKFRNGLIWEAPSGSYPRYSLETLRELEQSNELYFSETGTVSAKRYLMRVQEGQPFDALLRTEVVGYNSDGTKELTNLLNEEKLFSQPKPTKLIAYLLSLQNKKDSLILDFFSGSATTAHAVMKLNSEDGGNRKYIMVQIPETISQDKPAFKAGYKTIDEIGRERIKRAAEKIKEEKNADIDYGFKLIKLKDVNQNTLDKILDFNPDNNKMFTEDYVSDFAYGETSGKDVILTTWLNQDGYGLHAKSEKLKLVNYTVDVYENSIYIINEGITSSDIMKLVEKVENNNLNINRVVVYPYSLTFSLMHEMRNNLKYLRNNKELTLIERY
ncbi:site-specific DNA-methyltransferase [Clostridium perfringens]|uniref:site-specific DNA-methyltransferase n=2 Tax=Clostridium perfringens TaxID=1502 RepID=UPI001CC9AB64|nr:site-specific DNA-methyltransferase [Clostridium perfringens]ELC8433707.1 site-specific DNA-methyltransferase [Clostridium perfringens]ELP5178554.1 site-specific DNA-methyltransferase [Clostridium perfringens]ELP5180477.1 site-specific DNA-methyltransferase [Clostridium perfringens]ELP5183337.1 site-specific DNA-methyltransferase [Clostridium perfringens]ELP5187397.1 site-specific DNA-methyltransferase [Clostridium perfringens]